jgi:hypothetical protein
MTLDGSVNTGLSAGQRIATMRAAPSLRIHYPHEHRNPAKDRHLSVQVYTEALITFASAIRFMRLLVA